MTIGIDISPLQSGHRMRGIGFVIFNFINHISKKDRKKHKYIFFMFDKKKNNPLELLDLKEMNYDVRFLAPRRQAKTHSSNKSIFYRRMRKLLKSTNFQMRELRDRYMGNSEIKDLSGIDVFIQTDQSRSLPRGHQIKKVLIVYDIIPYVLEWEYLWSYDTARLRGLSRKAALRCKARRWLYLKKLKVNTRRADLLLAISNVTKNDFIKYVGANPKKMKVIHLGVSPTKVVNKEVKLRRYFKTSWDYYSSKPFKLDLSVPFILYVGGADKRRKIGSLVTAFNNIKGEGVELNLLLTGDTMQGPDNISTEAVQYALKSSSYLKDIVFLGFTDDATRNWLYKNASALIYPSKYEGFGLPVLEAMTYGCPVICYRNDAVQEVAGEVPIYAQNAEDIRKEILNILSYSPDQIKTLKQKSINSAKQFTWTKTSTSIISAIEILG